MTDLPVSTDADHWTDYFEQVACKESERTVVILSVVILDEALGRLLRETLLPCPSGTDPLFDGAYAPLSTFSSKIEFAARMGLISAGVAQSFHLIRKLRNDFAHNIANSSFADNAVRSRVRELKKLNDVAKPERRAHFPDGTLGDFQCAVSWLIYWVWLLVERLPARCPECGARHQPHLTKSASPAD